MHALYIVVPILCIVAIAYRYYSAFIAARLMALDDARITPAHELNDGHNYYPTHRLVLFGVDEECWRRVFGDLHLHRQMVHEIGGRTDAGEILARPGVRERCLHCDDRIDENQQIRS